MFQRAVWIVIVAAGCVTTFSAQGQKPTPTRIWADKTTDVSGRVSRDGRILPFVDWSTYGLSVRDQRSGEVRAIATGNMPSYPMTPTPSHDGKQIAYILDRALHVVPVSGGPPKVVYNHAQLFQVGDWTPDGAAIIVTQMADARQQEIGLVTVASGAYRKLADGRGAAAFWAASSIPYAVYEQWTPDASSRRELRILSLKDGTVDVLLTGADDFSPVWSPQDDRVLFVSDRNGGRGLWCIDVRDGKTNGSPQLVQALDEDMSLIGLTADGTAYFAHQGGTFATYVARVSWPSGEVTDPKPIATPPFLGARRGVFSPDGTSLATVFRAASAVVRPGWQTPAITDLTTGRQRTFPSHLTFRDELGWLPDGRLLIAINDDPGQGEGAGPPWTFWQLTPADGSMKRVGAARDSGLIRLAGVTHREVVYKRDLFAPTRTTFIEVLDLQTGNTRELYQTTDDVTDASLSPDGKRIALTIRAAKLTDIYVLNVGETKPTKLPVPSFRANAIPQAMWLASQDALIVSGAIGQEQGIWRVPLNGSAPQRLKLVAERVTEARLSPGGSEVAYSTRSNRGRELWVLRGAAASR